MRGTDRALDVVVGARREKAAPYGPAPSLDVLDAIERPCDRIVEAGNAEDVANLADVTGLPERELREPSRLVHVPVSRLAVARQSRDDVEGAEPQPLGDRLSTAVEAVEGSDAPTGPGDAPPVADAVLGVQQRPQHQVARDRVDGVIGQRERLRGPDVCLDLEASGGDLRLTRLQHPFGDVDDDHLVARCQQLQREPTGTRPDLAHSTRWRPQGATKLERPGILGRSRRGRTDGDVVVVGRGTLPVRSDLRLVEGSFVGHRLLSQDLSESCGRTPTATSRRTGEDDAVIVAVVMVVS